MRLTANQARRVLRDAGVYWSDYNSLRGQRDRAFDPVIKTACDVLLTFLVFGARRERKFETVDHC